MIQSDTAFGCSVIVCTSWFEIVKPMPEVPLPLDYAGTPDQKKV